jgi:hypothetical protein
MTKQQLVEFKGGSQGLPEGSDDYYAALAWEYCGISIRDNSLAGWVSIGKQIDAGDTEGWG